jgi:uncharacterized DUF497 family protein
VAHGRPFQFEWDEAKADANARKHGGIARNGVPVAVVYLWSDADPAAIKVRLISARGATQAEQRQYQEGL